MSKQQGFKVMAERCKTCIFSQNTPISRERFLELREAWRKEDIQQECHQATVAHQHIACRGHFDQWYNGHAPYPLNTIKHDLHMDDLTNEQFLDVCKNMGWITFTTPEDK